MSDTKELLERAWRKVSQPERVMDSLIRRRARKNRNRRIAAAVVAITVALLSFTALIRTFRTLERPADEPTPRDIFAQVHGWITYGNATGIWAVDPTRPGDPKDQILLSERQGEPLAWSSDGSKLLIWRFWREGKQFWSGLFVLHADGTETRVEVDHQFKGSIFNMIGKGSFSPDGSSIVYAETLGPSLREDRSGIYVVDAKGGTPRQLLASSRRLIPGEGTFHTSLYEPTVSPDGTQIAYFDGMGDWGHSLWVMDADGSDPHVLVDNELTRKAGHIFGLAWSPDGLHLAFGFRGYGIFVVGADGSGFHLAIPEGITPYWSPDGSRISYQHQEVSGGVILGTPGALDIAEADGTHVQKFGYAGSGPWNPLPLSKSGDHEPMAVAVGSGTAGFVYAIVALGVVGVLVLAWRARRRSGAS